MPSPAPDPVLEKLAQTNTFDSDWPTLRHHLEIALISSLPLFLSLRTPPPSSQTLDAGRASSASPPTPPPPGGSSPRAGSRSPRSSGLGGDSLLLSPTPTSPTSPTTPTASASRTDQRGDDAYAPSTVGGLVIPPFPPLDPERRSRRPSSSSSSGAEAGASGVASGAAAGPSSPSVGAGLGGPRMNGAPPGPAGPGGIPRAGAGVLFETEWDEEVVIGGKVLPGFMDEVEGRREIDRLVRMLGNIDSPPFTIQRLAELLLSPTEQHRTLGKFLRAFEKNLLVTTAWEPPSYSPVPPSSFAGARGLFGPSSSSSPSLGPSDPLSAATAAIRPTAPPPESSAADEADTSSAGSSSSSSSTMPVGATTPMFSPIPFLRPSAEHEQEHEHTMDIDMGSDPGLDELDVPGPGHRTNGAAGPRLMSPLVLDQEMTNGNGFGDGHGNESGNRNGNGNGFHDSAEGVGGAGAEAREDASYEPRAASSYGMERANGGDHGQERDSASGTRDRDTAVESSLLSGTDSLDPAHQPYLGRVDEMDTGPLPTSHSSALGNGDASTTAGSSSIGTNAANRDGGAQPNSHGHAASAGQVHMQGTGEGGNMTPHGMSDRPVPISATTVVSPTLTAGRTVGAARDGDVERGERRIAGIPRNRSVVGGLNERFVAQEGDAQSRAEGASAATKDET